MRNFSKKSSDIFICMVCLFFSFSFFILLFFSSHKDFSERENRALQELPKLSFSAFADGSFFEDISDFSADQFPARNFFCSISSLSEIALLREESNGIIVAKDGYLISRHDNASNEILSENLEDISYFFQINCNVPSFLLVAPRAIDVEKQKLPAFFLEDYGEKEHLVLHEKISNDKLIDPRDELEKLSQNGVDIWYKTDHHWSTRGAYEAYLSLCQSIGEDAYQLEYFDIQQVSEDFFGTSFSKSGLPEFCSDADTVELYRYAGDGSITVTSPTTQKTTYGFYDMTALERKDKYQIFLGGNTDILQIRDTSKEKPKMLLIKDSFANSLIPFLALHYDIDVIDLRYYRRSLREFMENNRFDTILLVYGIDTLSCDISCSHITK